MPSAGPSVGSMTRTAHPVPSAARTRASRTRPSRASNPRAWTAAAVIACALGMGSKEVMVGAPLLVVAWDWTLLSLPFRQLIARRWPLYVGLAATWILLGALVAVATLTRAPRPPV